MQRYHIFQYRQQLFRNFRKDYSATFWCFIPQLFGVLFRNFSLLHCLFSRCLYQMLRVIHRRLTIYDNHPLIMPPLMPVPLVWLHRASQSASEGTVGHIGPRGEFQRGARRQQLTRGNLSRSALSAYHERFGTHYNNPSFGSAAEREVVVVVYRLTMKRDVLRRD